MYACADLWRLQTFVWWGRMSGMKVSVGEGTHAQVPLRGGGGILKIGRKNILGYRGAIKLGSGSILLQPRGRNAVIEIGDRNLLSNNVALVANQSISIGSDCQIGDMVCIYDSDFHEIAPVTRNRSQGTILPVKIGDNVWLGSRVMVLKGVTIGDNSVVGAMSVVTRSIPANCIAAGNPARVIRSIE